MATEGRDVKTNRRRRLQRWVGGLTLLAATGVGATGFVVHLDPSSRADAATVVTPRSTALAESTDPSTEPTGPATEPTDPASEPTDPTADPTDPSTEPSTSAPVVTHRTIRKRQSIPFATRHVKTSALKKGVTKVKQGGQRGVRVTVYRLTFKDGVQSGRSLVRKFVARRPVPRIVLHGTHVNKPKPSSNNKCDPNYAGACVPIASDVDCGGGSGNGPAYVYGTVRVVGSDIYGLDSDGDGYGCE